MNMSHPIATLGAGIVLLAASAQTLAFFDKPENRVLSADEVKELFAGRTVESYNLGNWRTSFTYYHPNGRLTQERLWRKRTGKWRVMDDGRICLKFKKSHRCRFVVERGDSYYKMLPPKKGSSQSRLLIRYRNFVEGNALASD